MQTEERRFDFDKNLPLDLKIKNLAEIKAKPGLLIKPSKATSYLLIWISEGEVTLEVDFRNIPVKAGQLLIISVNQEYRFDTISDYSGKMILFTNTFFTQSYIDDYFFQTSEILNPDKLNQIVQLDACRVEKVLLLLEEELKLTTDKYQPYIASSLLRMLLFEAERKLQLGRPVLQSDHEVYLSRQFCNEVEKHFRKLKHTEHYMHMLGACEKTLTRELKATIKTTPKKYLISRVVLEAKRLLACTNLAIKDISLELDFDEVTNFNKYFFKHAGMNPSIFRDQYHQK